METARYCEWYTHLVTKCLFYRNRRQKKPVRDAFAAGILNDLGSGSNVDVCVITKDKVDYIRPYDEASLNGQR